VKRKALLLVLLVTLTFSLHSRPYIGINQGLVGTGIEVGYLTRSFEQNLSIQFPFVQGATTPMAATVNVLYRTQRLNPVVIGLGPTARIAWQKEQGFTLGGGFMLSVGWEVLAKREILFVEGAYIPFKTSVWGPLDVPGERLVDQYIRIGWRHLF
jgi:hypothetical protein